MCWGKTSKQTGCEVVMQVNIHKTYDISDLSHQEYNTILIGLDLIIKQPNLAPDTANEMLTKLKRSNGEKP